MALRRTQRAVLILAGLVTLSACSNAGTEVVMQRSPAASPPPTAVITRSPSTTQATTPIPTTAAAPPATAAPETTPTPVPVASVPARSTPATSPPPSAPPTPRVIVEQAWTPFATAESVTLVHPSSRVERIGFHQSNHDGARQMEPLPGATNAVTMESRNRPTGSRTSADVVIDPAVEVRAPVSGTIKRSGTYVLYCEYSDDFAVIEPDARPGFEVKILHIDGVRVHPGDQVVAGKTVIAGGPTILPFASQVDELTTAGSPWPHVHIEVIDLAIPDIPDPGGGC